MKWCQIFTFKSVQCHPALTYIFNFWHSGTLALSPECQSVRMSEIENVGQTWMGKGNQLTHLPFKELLSSLKHTGLTRLSSVFCRPTTPQNSPKLTAQTYKHHVHRFNSQSHSCIHHIIKDCSVQSTQTTIWNDRMICQVADNGFHELYLQLYAMSPTAGECNDWS